MFSDKIYRNFLILLLIQGKTSLKRSDWKINTHLKYIFNVKELHFKYLALILNSFISLNIKC